ncbi:MAG: response regulator [Magnetococcales bacterium]|nr:response regulator [Magnetococcales bacterium]
MQARMVKGLLVEDDVGFAGLLNEWLDGVVISGSVPQPITIRLTLAESLEKAMMEVDSGAYDILLVDLNLPDSRGLSTFERISGRISDIPVIVLSGLDDESLAIQAVRSGAQDYLVKNAIDGNLLFRSIRYALERFALHQELERAREAERRQRELGSLERLAERGLSQISAQMLGLQGLKEGYPDTFEQMVARLALALGKLLRMRTHKVFYDLSTEMKQIASELGFIRCGPRDVVDLYTATLKKCETPGNYEKNETVHEECRYLAFELMGHLVFCYRSYALGGQVGTTSAKRTRAGP